MKDKSILTLLWSGSDRPHIDEPYVYSNERIHMGLYGGNSMAGADKNEDGALAWADATGAWEFAALLDGHHTSESVDLLLSTLQFHHKELVEILCKPVSFMFTHLQAYLVSLLSTLDTSGIQGESSCLLIARKEHYLWWLNVGDVVLYLLHPEYAALGQFAVNQRSFYEWIGEVNTFGESVPCYASGVKQLRNGRNVIIACTDGVLECGNRPFEDPEALYHAVYGSNVDISSPIKEILKTVHNEQGKDSATVLAWAYDCEQEGPVPSNVRLSRSHVSNDEIKRETRESI